MPSRVSAIPCNSSAISRWSGARAGVSCAFSKAWGAVARKPAGRRGVRRPGAGGRDRRLRGSAHEPAAAVRHAARIHSRDLRYLRASARSGPLAGSALERRAQRRHRWAGNPEQPTMPALDTSRTLGHRFSRSRVFLRQPSVRATPEKLKRPSRIRHRRYRRRTRRFCSTGAVVEAADLVISIDSSVAHLAGALGKPVWLLTRQWRTGAGGSSAKTTPGTRRAAVPPDRGRYVACRRRTRRGRAPRGACGRQAAADAVPGRGRGAGRAGGGDHRGVRAWRGDRPRATAPAPQLLAHGRATPPGRQIGDAQDRSARAAKPSPTTPRPSTCSASSRIIGPAPRGDRASAPRRRARAEQPLYHANLGEMCRLAGADRRGRRRRDERAGIAARPILAPEQPRHRPVRQGRFEEALERLDRALALQDNFAVAHSNRGNALQRLKRFREAEARLSPFARTRAALRRRLEQSRHIACANSSVSAKPRRLIARRGAEAARSRHSRQPGAGAEGSGRVSTRPPRRFARRWRSRRAATRSACISGAMLIDRQDRRSRRAGGTGGWRSTRTTTTPST